MAVSRINDELLSVLYLRGFKKVLTFRGHGHEVGKRVKLYYNTEDDKTVKCKNFTLGRQKPKATIGYAKTKNGYDLIAYDDDVAFKVENCTLSFIYDYATQVYGDDPEEIFT